MKRIRRKTSKRLSVHQKHKIEKRVLQHNKKMRRTAKLSGIHKGKPKESSIPNSCPFKLEMLQEMHQKKVEEQAMREELRQRRRQVEVDSEFRTVSSRTQAPMTAELQQFLTGLGDPDVVIEVLEASDPEFYRCPDVEEWVVSAGKKLVLALHKSDLVDPEILKAWLHKYSQEFTCVATSKKTGKLRESILQVIGFSAVSTTGKIAVIGFPNVGKSSLANVILGDKRMRVSTQPGCTIANQSHSLESHIGVSVIDTVGLTALGASDNAQDPVAVLKRVTSVDQSKDPFTPVQGILMKLSPEKLQVEYEIPPFSTIQEFLGEIAKKKSLYKRPGMVDYEGAAKVVLFDWATRKIRYEVSPEAS